MHRSQPLRILIHRCHIGRARQRCRPASGRHTSATAATAAAASQTKRPHAIDIDFRCRHRQRVEHLDAGQMSIDPEHKRFLAATIDGRTIGGAQLNAAAEMQPLAIREFECGKCGGEKFLDQILRVRFRPAFFHGTQARK